MKIHQRALAALAIGGLLWGCGSEPRVGRSARAVIAGQPSPGDLGFTLHPLEENAVVAQVVTEFGQSYQGCTGTLIGDRLVVSAGHCVIRNQQAWLEGTAEPRVVAASTLQYVVGADIDQPDCTLDVAAIHLNPRITVTEMHGIEHDVSLSVLERPLTESCPHAIPLQLNEAPLAQEMLGQTLLQGGYGSLDGSYDFSPVRYWSALELSQMDRFIAMLTDSGRGFPTYGDSGSAALHRFDDGALRAIGVVSGGSALGMAFIRLDNEAEFYGEVADLELLCGAVGAAGACIGAVRATCDGHGFRIAEDCAAQGLRCLTDGAGGAVCGTPPEPDAGPLPDAGVGPDPDGGVDAASVLSPTEVDEGGRGCSVGGGKESGVLWLLLLALIVARGRRRATGW